MGRAEPGPRNALLFAGLTAVYVAAGWLGLSLAFENASVSLVWPPTGVAIAAVIVFGSRVWPALAAGAFLVSLGTTGAVISSLGVAAGNTMEALIAGWLVNRYANGRLALESTRSFFKFVGLAGLLSPVASATLGVLSLVLGGRVSAEHMRALWVTWWAGDMLGALLLTPAILLWKSNPLPNWSRRRTLEAALWLSLIVFTSLSNFTGLLAADYKLFSRGVPLMLLLVCVALRFGAREASSGLLIVSGIAAWGTFHGNGPFVSATPQASFLLLQNFLAMASVLVLAPAVTIGERRRAEARARAFFDQAVVGIADCDFRLRLLRVNQRFCDMLGYSREALLARSVLDVTHPDDRDSTRARFERLEAEGTPSSVDKRYVRADGTTLWVRAHASRVVPEHGQLAYAATVVEDITLRKAAEEAIQRAATLEERSRLAGEIHDSLSQSFVGIVLHLDNAAETLPAGSESARGSIRSATQLARTALDHARRSLHDLTPRVESRDLPTALQAAAAGLLAGTGVAFDFGCDGAVRRLSPEIEEQAFYLGMEAFAIAWRHGTPTRLECRLRFGAGELQLEVADDGGGGPPAPMIDTGLALRNLQVRAQRIGAGLNIRDDPGRRNSVKVLLPLGHS